MLSINKDWIIYFGLILIGASLFIPCLGIVHLFDWDEINFAEVSREMLLSGNYLDVQMNFQPFWEKPPLFFWIQALSMKLFGINEFAARLPNSLVGIATMITLFRLGSKLESRRFGLLWVLLFISSFLPFFYFKSGIIDPLFNLFIFLGIYQAAWVTDVSNENNNTRVFLAAFFLGLATLTKGPVALLVFLLTLGICCLARKNFKAWLNWKSILIFVSTYLLVGGFWFILQVLSGNFSILEDFFGYMLRLFSQEDAGHGGFFAYHFVVLLIGVFPASILALPYLGGKKADSSPSPDFRWWMLILFWVVLILFTIVRTKIVHYSSLCYFPLTYFAAWKALKILEDKEQLSVGLKRGLSALAALWAIGLSALPLLEANKQRLLDGDWLQSAFIRGMLEAEVEWSAALPIISGLFLFLVLYFLWFAKQQKVMLFGLCFSSLVFVYVSIIQVVPRIERYTQHAAIEFYKEKAAEDCYVATYGFKSYAPYFYTRVKDHPVEQAKDLFWLITGETDKPVYIVCKVNKRAQFEQVAPRFEHLFSRNGFSFFIKIPDNS